MMPRGQDVSRTGKGYVAYGMGDFLWYNSGLYRPLPGTLQDSVARARYCTEHALLPVPG
jgi:hypothetical protein